MRTWLRIACAAGSLTIAALLSGCTAAGPATHAATPDRSIVAEPSSAPPLSTAPTSPDTAPGPTTAAPPPAGSGITGRITVDGGCPVVTDPPCPDRPYPARITITEATTGKAMASLVSGQDGAYRIALPPGRYVLHVASPEGHPFPRPASVTVVVPPGHYATENVRLDTGIR